jgi:hypothetical protein
MKSRKSQIALFLLLALVFAACNSNPSRTVRATQAIPQTATTTATPRQATATWYLKTATPISPTPPPNDIGYFDGVIVITQYFTFLSHGLYEEAYQLLSSSARTRIGNLEDYMEYEKSWFTKLEIISIYPQYLKTNSVDRRRFIVTFIFWGEGRLSGAGVSGEEQTLYLTLVRENGKWKIDSFDTA